MIRSGRHSELRDHAIAIEARVGHRIDERHVFADQLRKILIGRRDDDAALCARRLIRQRSDYVVRFDAVDDQQRQSHRANDVVDRRDLNAQIVRHGRTIRLVFRIEFVAEGATFRVEHDGNRTSRIILGESLQHSDDASHRAGGMTVHSRQRRQCVKRAEQIRRTVDENQGFVVGHELGQDWNPMDSITARNSRGSKQESASLVVRGNARKHRGDRSCIRCGS